MPDPPPNIMPPPDLWAAEPAADRSDLELLTGIRVYQPAALHELYTRYFPPAYALAVRMLDEPSAAEVCVQQVFLDLGHHPPLTDPPHNDVGAWVLQAVHQQARTWQQHPSPPQLSLAADLPPLVTLPTPPPGLVRLAVQHRLAEQQHAARVALASLAPIERQVLEWAYFQGMTQAQIAAALPAPLRTVQQHLRTGLAQLRAALAAGAAPASDAAASVPSAPTGVSDVSPLVPVPAPLVPLAQLTDALTRMETAQQQAAALRLHTQTVQRQAQQAQQRAAAQQQRANTTLQQFAVLRELYAYLDAALVAPPPAEEVPFAHTAAYFAQHPDHIAVSQVIAILEALNAQSDRDAHRLLPLLLV